MRKKFWMLCALSAAIEILLLECGSDNGIKTRDKRTVRRRLEKLDQKAEDLGIQGWIEKTREGLGELIRASAPPSRK